MSGLDWIVRKFVMITLLIPCIEVLLILSLVFGCTVETDVATVRPHTESVTRPSPSVVRDSGMGVRVGDSLRERKPSLTAVVEEPVAVSVSQGPSEQTLKKEPTAPANDSVSPSDERSFNVPSERDAAPRSAVEPLDDVDTHTSQRGVHDDLRGAASHAAADMRVEEVARDAHGTMSPQSENHEIAAMKPQPFVDEYSPRNSVPIDRAEHFVPQTPQPLVDVLGTSQDEHVAEAEANQPTGSEENRADSQGATAMDETTDVVHADVPLPPREQRHRPTEELPTLDEPSSASTSTRDVDDGHVLESIVAEARNPQERMPVVSVETSAEPGSDNREAESHVKIAESHGSEPTKHQSATVQQAHSSNHADASRAESREGHPKPTAAPLPKEPNEREAETQVVIQFSDAVQADEFLGVAPSSHDATPCRDTTSDRRDKHLCVPDEQGGSADGDVAPIETSFGIPARVSADHVPSPASGVAKTEPAVETAINHRPTSPVSAHDRRVAPAFGDCGQGDQHGRGTISREPRVAVGELSRFIERMQVRAGERDDPRLETALAHCYRQRAQMYLELREPQRAMNDIQRVFDHASENQAHLAADYVIRGRALTMLSRAREAILDFSLALTEQGQEDQESWLYARGIAYFHNRQFAHGIQDVSQACRHGHAEACQLLDQIH